jgi:transcriptional regulator with XRE-family HTH domain
VAGIKVGSLGDYIREQRQHAQVSLRQLARSAGVSNPYLSQVERGLKKPSAEMLQQIAKGLRISAETLYVHAGFLEERATTSDVVGAVLADATLDERQKRVLLDIYDSFRRENASSSTAPTKQPTKQPRKQPTKQPRKPATTTAAATRAAKKTAAAEKTGTKRATPTTPAKAVTATAPRRTNS